MHISIDSVEDIPEVLKELATNEMLKAFHDERVHYVIHYPEGFVANSYKWPCPRTAKVLIRQPEGHIVVREKHYDAKRPHGRGPTWVAFSYKNGRLASG